MKTAYRTDVGRIRTVNEDSAAVEGSADGLTIAVLADGMGGHQAGDIASRTTIEIMMEELRRLRAEMDPAEWEAAVWPPSSGRTRKSTAGRRSIRSMPAWGPPSSRPLPTAAG